MSAATAQSPAAAAALKLTLVSTSQRPGSNSRKVADLSRALLLRRPGVAEVTLFDLGSDPLPLFQPGDAAGQAAFAPLRDALAGCDGLALVTPEWHGMASPAANNLLLYAGASLIGHKAGQLISVSSGQGGAYPIAALRAAGTKNNRLCWTPDHMIFRQCAEGLAAAERDGLDSDHPAVQRLDYCLGLFTAYAQALRSVRQSGLIDHERFANGL